MSRKKKQLHINMRKRKQTTKPETTPEGVSVLAKLITIKENVMKQAKERTNTFKASVINLFRHPGELGKTVRTIAISAAVVGIILPVAMVYENIKITQIKAAASVQVAEASKATAEANARSNAALASANPIMLEAIKNAVRDTPSYNLTINQYGNQGRTDAETEMARTEEDKKNYKYSYTPEQRRALTIAYHVGQKIGYPETIQAILLTETRACSIGNRIGDTNLPMGKRSYGCMQVKVATAKKVLRAYPQLVKEYFPGRTYASLHDEEIILRMIQDDVFNITVAAMNFVVERNAVHSWNKAVVAYNTGLGGLRAVPDPKHHVYYEKVVQAIIKEVRPFNRRIGLVKPKVASAS